MRNKIVIGILLVALAGMTALGVYQIAVLHDFRPRTITSLLLSLTAGIITLIRILSGHRHMPSRFYAKQYGNILRTAFAQDRLSLIHFYKAIDLFNQNRPLKAVRQLEKLLTPTLTLAIAHHLKVDTEASDNYVRLYALNGGDGKMLSQRLEKTPAAGLENGWLSHFRAGGSPLGRGRRRIRYAAFADRQRDTRQAAHHVGGFRRLSFLYFPGQPAQAGF